MTLAATAGAQTPASHHLGCECERPGSKGCSTNDHLCKVWFKGLAGQHIIEGRG